MTNLEALSKMTAEEVAAVIHASRYELLGWTYPDLIEWLKSDDNITGKVTQDLIAFCWRTFNGLCVS